LTWWQIILSGFEALRDHIALHVLTCLIPAFLLAGVFAVGIIGASFLRLG